MDKLAEIQQTLHKELAEMNEIIRSSLATPNQLMNQVVTSYLESKGKQIRPIMVIVSAGMFGKVNEHVLHAGAALEMLHNASLIHDDVVDETPLRRGRATINHEWGNHIAVLVGDYFVSNALSAGIRTGNIAIIAALSDLGKELSTGEIDQICNARYHHFDEESYISMIRKKTASLFMNCVKMGAEAAGARPEQYATLIRFAELFGLCFQIKDDIFDYSDNSRIGKPTGNDLREGKVTLPLLYALDNAPAHKAQEMKDVLRRGDLSTDEIASLLQFACENGGIEYAYGRMREMQREAYSLLRQYPESHWRKTLHDIFDYIISRDI